MFGDKPRWKFESRIDPTHLRIGHFVTRLDRPWSETHFPLQGVLIDTEGKKAWMVENCAWVVISHVRGPIAGVPLSPRRLPRPSEFTHKPRARTIVPGRVSRETLDRALSIYDSLDQQARELANQFRQRGRIDVSRAREMVHELADVLEQNLAALLWLTRIKERDNYTAQHCINVSILAIGLAHSLSWGRQRVEHAGLAGLLHDLGKTLVDQAVLNKEGRLTEREFAEIQRHTELGYQMLCEDGNMPKLVAEAVLYHHERPDGSGYPHGLPCDRIPPLARLVAIVDAYDAITSHRIYDPARSHHEALGILWKERGSQFDGMMVEAFTQFMGWVTPGTLVRLTDGQLAVVLRAKDGRGLLPLVRVLERAESGHRLGRILDLASESRDRGNPALRIDEVLPDGAEGVDVRDLSLNFD
jgi:putative nucleotidyltransferase with HDIG domain